MPYLELNGHAHHDQSAGAGRPLLFLHGAFVDSEMWAPEIAHFSDGYQVVVYDLRGHGKTGPSDRPHYSIELLADDLAQLVNQLRLNATIICGRWSRLPCIVDVAREQLSAVRTSAAPMKSGMIAEADRRLQAVTV